MVAVGAGGIRRAELMEDTGPMRGHGDTTVEEPTDVTCHDLVTYGDGTVDPYTLG